MINIWGVSKIWICLDSNKARLLCPYLKFSFINGWLTDDRRNQISLSEVYVCRKLVYILWSIERISVIHISTTELVFVFKFFRKFYWHIVGLQCCVCIQKSEPAMPTHTHSVCCTEKWINYAHTHTPILSAVQKSESAVHGHISMLF